VKAGDEIVRLCNLAVLEAAVKAKDQRAKELRLAIWLAYNK